MYEESDMDGEEASSYIRTGCYSSNSNSLPDKTFYRLKN